MKSTRQTYAAFTGDKINYADWHKVSQEVHYCCTFAYKATLRYLLRDWYEFMTTTGKDLTQLTETECKAFEAIQEKMETTQALGLQLIGQEVGEWMKSYISASRG